MRLYGSLTNRLMEAGTRGQPQPVIGMGATTTSYTDRDAGTVISIEKLGKRTLICVQRDHAKRTDANGMSECQTYDYSPNPEGARYFFTAELPDGRWSEVRKNETTGRWNKVECGQGLRLGERQKYHDFSF